MLTEIYQTVLINYGYDIYIGNIKNVAFNAAKGSGYECSILKDGALIATFSPISGFKEYPNVQD